MPALGMIIACVATLAMVLAVADDRLTGALIAGMAAPLAAVVVTWLVIDRAARTDPQRVGRRLLGAFGVKVLFFGAYVVVALGVLQLDPKAFIVSFTCYFVALYLTEALLFRRVFAAGAPPAARS